MSENSEKTEVPWWKTKKFFTMIGTTLVAIGGSFGIGEETIMETVGVVEQGVVTGTFDWVAIVSAVMTVSYAIVNVVKSKSKKGE